jgi:hypothetical protein
VSYLFFAVGLYFAATFIDTGSTLPDLALKNTILLIYLIVVVITEKPQQLLRRKPKSPEPLS